MQEAQGLPDSLRGALARERLKNARRTNSIRFWGVSAFFLLFLVLGGLLRLPAWSGNLGLFTGYWVATAVIFLAGRRSERIVLASGMAVALFDAPIVFFLQWATFPTSNASGVAGFTVGVYVLFVILAAADRRAQGEHALRAHDRPGHRPDSLRLPGAGSLGACPLVRDQADRPFGFLDPPAHRARCSRSDRLNAFELIPAARRIATVRRDTDFIGGFRLGVRLWAGSMTRVV